MYLEQTGSERASLLAQIPQQVAGLEGEGSRQPFVFSPKGKSHLFSLSFWLCLSSDQFHSVTPPSLSLAGLDFRPVPTSLVES